MHLFSLKHITGLHRPADYHFPVLKNKTVSTIKEPLPIYTTCFPPQHNLHLNTDCRASTWIAHQNDLPSTHLGKNKPELSIEELGCQRGKAYPHLESPQPMNCFFNGQKMSAFFCFQTDNSPLYMYRHTNTHTVAKCTQLVLTPCQAGPNLI